MIEWEIVEGGFGDFIAMKVGRPKRGTLAGYKPGFFYGSIIYESSRFDTYDKAKEYIARKTQAGDDEISC